MKTTQRAFVTAAACLLTLASLTGCSTNMGRGAARGATVGAISGSFAGAVADLVVTGSVNTDRLAHNMVSGAVGGATAGAAAGHRQDQAQARTQAQPVQAPKAPAPDQELIGKIGKDNYTALEHLCDFRHEDAFRATLKASRSKTQDHREAAYAIQALIDKDRGNQDGMQEAMKSFLELNDTVKDQKAAEAGLNDLYVRLQDERRARGISKP